MGNTTLLLVQGVTGGKQGERPEKKWPRSVLRRFLKLMLNPYSGVG